MAKVALITGGSRGIGRALAIGLADDGYQLALLARSEPQLQAVASIISARHPRLRVLSFPTDVSREAEVNEVVTRVVSELGQIDLAINCAGVNAQGSLELSHAEFDHQLAVNLRGAFNVAKAAVPVMERKKSGYLINVASVCGVTGFAGVGAYTASKFGLVGFSQSLFRELVPKGIKVTCLCPSWVDTEMASHSPLSGEQMIQPDDILTTVRYLLSLSPTACIRELIIECRYDLL